MKKERTYEQIQALATHRQRCVESVPTPRRMHYHRCQNIGQVWRKGEWYCNIHDPVQKAERNKKREAKQATESKEQRRKWALESCGADGYELAKLCRDTFMIGDHEAEDVLNLARRIVAKVEGKE